MPRVIRGRNSADLLGYSRLVGNPYLIWLRQSYPSYANHHLARIPNAGYISAGRYTSPFLITISTRTGFSGLASWKIRRGKTD